MKLKLSLLTILFTCTLITLFGQTTVTIYPTASSMNTGWVNSAGTKTSGDMQVSTSTSYGRGWAKFSLSSIPSNAVITSVVLKFYSYGGTTSTTTNSIRGFTGNPVSMVGSTLYSTIGSGVIYNSSIWTNGTTSNPSLNSLTLSASSFVQSQITTGYVNFGFVRGTSSLNSIYGYSNSNYKVRLQVTYTVCTGTPNEPYITLSNSNGCSGYSAAHLSSGNLSTGVYNQWQMSLDSIFWNNITNATNANLDYNANSSCFFRLKSECPSSGEVSYSNIVDFTVLQSPPTPIININGNTTFCSGDSLLLNSSLDSSYSYQWRKDGVGIYSTNDTSIYVNESGTYTLIATNNLGCVSGSSELLVTVNPRPNVTITSSLGDTICSGETTAIVADNLSGDTYQWFIDTTEILNANNSSLTAGVSGSYSLLITKNYSGLNCSSSSNTIVLVVSSPEATIQSQGISTICQGGTVLLTANSGSGLTYQWVNNGTNISGATSSTYSATSEGTYTVIVTNSDLCSTTSNSLVLSLNQLTTSISPLTTSMNTGYVTSAGGKTTGNMLVSTSTTYGRGWVKFPLSSIPVGSIITSVVIKFYTYGGTTSTTSNTIRGFTGDPVTMTGSTLYTTSGNGTIYNSSTWSIGTTTTPSLNTKVLPASGRTFVQNQLTTGYVNFGFVGGSTSLQSIYGNNNSTYGVRLEIAYNPPPPPATINVSGNTTFCQGNTLNLTSNSSVGYSYQWKNNGTNILGANSSSYAASSSGNYTVQVTNTSGCVTISNGTAITVNPLPNVTLTNLEPLSFCQGGSVILNANSNDTAFQWKKNGVNISGATSSTYTANSAGSYTVTVINSFGCSNSSNSVNVIVNSLPNPNISGSTSICQGDTSVLSINSNTGITYQWLNNGVFISDATNYFHATTSPGSYSVLVTNANGCSATSPTVSVVVNPLPTASISATSATTFCQGGSTNLIADNNVGLSYQWYKNGVPINGANSSNYEATTSGNYYVYLFDNLGCTNISFNEIQVIENTNPYLLISSDTSICLGETTSLMAVSNGNITWNGSFNQNSIEVQPSATSLYSVSAIDSNNCITSGQVIIEVNFPKDTTIYTSSYGPFVLNGQVYQESGVYTQNLQTVAGCDSILTIHLNYIANSLLELKDFGIVLYPNPSKDGIIYINSSNEFYIGEIIILNSLGLVVDRLMYKDVLDLSNLANGMYWIQFNIEGNTFYEKIIKG